MPSSWEFWHGQVLGPGLLGFDTETVADQDLDRTHPELVLATAFDGVRTVVIHREEFAEFLSVHKDCEFVCHNVAFDFWVVENWLRKREETLTHTAWWEIADSGRLHDTMLLDQLVRIGEGQGAQGKGGTHRRNLGVLAEAVGSPFAADVDKESQFRKRFGELLEMHWSLADPGFFEYAVRDAQAVWDIYHRLVARAEAVVRPFEDAFLPDARKTFGILTETIQVQAAIALRDMTVRGIAFDREYARTLETRLRSEVQTDWEYLLSEFPEIFKYDKRGTLLLTPKGKVPATKTDAKKAVIERVARSLCLPLYQSSGKTGGLSTSAKLWAQHADRHPFFGTWTRTVKSKDLLKFFAAFEKHEDNVLHPRYETLVRTGRTSSYGDLNIQQMPRLQDFRRCFVARPGHRILTIDYCLHPDTAVKTLEGDKPISSVHPGDKVYTLRGQRIAWGTITKKADIGMLPSYRITFDSGHSVIASSDHTWPVRIREPGRNGRYLLATKRTDELLPGTRMVPCKSVFNPVTKDITYYSYSCHEYAKEHEIVAEAYHGPRPAGHDIHHVNGDHTDNRPENLQYVPESEHLSAHSRLYWDNITPDRKARHLAPMRANLHKRRSYIGDGNPNFGKFKEAPRTCLKCGATFRRPPSLNAKYCSRSCYYEATSAGLNCKIQSVEYVGLQPAVAITIDPDHNFVLACGVVTNNCAIELRTFAAIAFRRFGFSRLGEIINAGIDPHVYTAALFNNMTYEEFSALKTTNPTKYKHDRQGSKAISFGTIGGLGAAKLTDYARITYGVDAPKEHWAAFRERLIRDIYPEMGLYLQSSYAKDLAYNLRIDRALIDEATKGILHASDSDQALLQVARILHGHPTYKDGRPYESWKIARAWRFMDAVVHTSGRTDLRRIVADRLVQNDNYPLFFGSPAVTLTGRVRDGCRYTDSKNTPFQALAADGIKLALWRCLRQGLRVIAMIHDELLVEVPEREIETYVPLVRQHLIEGMTEVTGGVVRIDCDHHVDFYWRK